MEPKKSIKADVDRRRGIYFQIGLVVALLFVIIAFEWRPREPQLMDLTSDLMVDDEEELIDVTRHEDLPPPPPPPPEIEIVEDDVVLEDDRPKIDDVEVTQETVIDIPVRREREEVKEDEIFLVVEKQPEFPGGAQAMFNWLGRNTRYPPMERDMGIEGVVHVTFVVEPDGQISNVKVLRGVNPGLDAEAMRVVKSMPRWTPGEQRGRAVRVQFTIPIRFRLSQ